MTSYARRIKSSPVKSSIIICLPYLHLKSRKRICRTTPKPSCVTSSIIMSNYSFSATSYSSSSSTVNGQTTSQSQSTYSNPQGTTVHRVSKEPGLAATQETFRVPAGGRLEGNGTRGNAQNRIEDVTDREYEENVEDEYAKREGGA